MTHGRQHHDSSSISRPVYNDAMHLKAPMGIVGAGAWGTALAYGFAQRTEVILYCHEPPELKKTQAVFRKKRVPVEVVGSLDPLFQTCQILVMAVPFQVLDHWFKTASKKYDLRPHIWINASKGISATSLKLFPQIIPAKLIYGVLSGPSFAQELIHDQPTSLVFASKNKQLCRAIQKKLSHSFLRIYTQDDPIGVSAGGALKNVLAIASGMAHGLGLQKNSIGALITRGVWEIARLTTALGGKGQTVFGLSGLGDILLSCYSDKSRNMRLGLLLGKGFPAKQALHQIGSTVEGYGTAKAAYRIILKKHIDAPICQEVHQVLYRQKDPHQSLQDLLRRPLKQEIFPT